MLAAAPKRIAADTDGLPARLLLARPQPQEWSANEVLAHLRSCGDVWGESMARIVGEDGPRIRAVNPRTWIAKTDYLSLEFAPSLAAYTRQRVALLRLLTPLAGQEWARTATVTGAGRPLTLRVHDYAHRMATHERAHLKQLAHTVATLAGSQS